MKPLLSAVALLVFASCSCESGPPPTVTTTGRPMAERLPDGKGLKHVARMNANLYRGEQPKGDGFAALKEMGIKTVICLRNHHSSKEEVEEMGMAYVAIPIKADISSRPPSDEQVKLFFDTVLDPAKAPAYFHCKVGRDRTGTMAAIYRIEVDGWTNEEAVEELQAFGYHDIYRDLINFVKEYKPRGFKPPKKK